MAVSLVALVLFVSALGLPDFGYGVKLNQADFLNGSYTITAPGTYVLDESIIFHPNGHIPLDPTKPETYLFPTSDQLAPGGKYSGPEYSLGFFAAIVIASNDVVLDLGGYSIVQSREHALMQRFYAHIELANAPFPAGAGPGTFATETTFVSVANVTILNGTLGRSSHHAIHGNSCERVLIKDMTLTDFEVAGVSLNSARAITMQNVDITNSRTDVPVSGRFSHAVFALRSSTVLLDLDNELSTCDAVERAVVTLRTSVSSVIEDVTNKIDVKHALFRTVTNGLPDGSLLAGVVIHPKVHVGDFLQIHEHKHEARDINLASVRISNLAVAPVEIAALKLLPGDAESDDGYEASQIHDNAGGVLDIDTIRHPETDQYIANELAELQLALAAYRSECERVAVSSPNASLPVCLQKAGSGVLLTRNKITELVLQWTRGAITFTDLVTSHRYGLAPNHDYMFHFNKGVIGIKLDGVATASMNDVDISQLENHATRQERSILFQAGPGYRGYDSRALAISSSMEVFGEVQARNLYSKYSSNTIAVDVRNNSTQTVLHLDRIGLPAREASLNGILPSNDPIFSRAGCPFAAARNVESGNDHANYGILYALLGTATLICALSLLVLGIYCVCFTSLLRRGSEGPKTKTIQLLEEQSPNRSNAMALS